MYLSKDNVSLREFEKTDIENKVKWINDAENNEYLHYDIPLTIEKTTEWFLSKDNKSRLDCVIEFMGVPVGVIGLIHIDYDNKKAEYYITIGNTSYKRKGIALIATKLILEHAFGSLGLKKVYLNVDENNEAACSLYEKAGFQCEGVFEDDMLFKGEWINRKRYAIVNCKRTNKSFNILILSVGTRNKIIQYFKRTFMEYGNVIVADMSEMAPALYEADKRYKVPKISETGYIDMILDICKKEKVSGVLSLIDPELSLLAQNKDRFEEQGVVVIGSPYNICENCLDKWSMFLWLQEHGYNCAKSYIDKNEFYADVENGKISYPVFVKPIFGSASLSVSKVYNKETIELLFADNNNLMIQEFLDGQEIGADAYIDMFSGEVISIFTKKKLVMRAGETDKAVSFKSEKLMKLLETFCDDFGFRGPIDIDVFEVNGEYYISEVNPRFGGGYPHAYECGCDHMTMILNNLLGRVNDKLIGQYDDGICMMKYNEVKVNRFN